MNKNSRAQRKLNQKLNKGGGGTVSQSVKRNMEQVVINGKTVHRPIDPTKPFRPFKQSKFFSNNSLEE